MKKSLKLIGFVIAFLLLSIIFGRYITYSYEVNDYKIYLSFWSTGPRYYITVKSLSGDNIVLKGHYPDLSNSLDYSPYFDDFILKKNISDTIYTFTDGLVVRNNGFVVETVIPPYWEQSQDTKKYSINKGSHFGKLFYKEGHNYEILDSSYFRITTSGESLYIHSVNRKLETIAPSNIQEKLFGIIPIGN